MQTRISWSTQNKQKALISRSNKEVSRIGLYAMNFLKTFSRGIGRRHAVGHQDLLNRLDCSVDVSFVVSLSFLVDFLGVPSPR